MRIVFCGVGALGSTTALSCRNLDATMRFVDFDRVESKNLLSQGFVKQSVGKNKATALKLQFANFYSMKSEAFGVRLTANNTEELLGDGDLLVDCFDNFDSRTLLVEYAREHGKPCVHGALSGDGTMGLIRWNDAFTPDREDTAGQPTCDGGEHLPLIAMLSATLARTIQEFVADGGQRNSMVSLSGVTRL